MPPRSVLISGTTGRGSAGNLPDWVKVTSDVEHWAVALGSDWFGNHLPTAQQLREYDLVVANLNPTRIHTLLRLASGRRANQKWAVIVEGDGLAYLDPSSGLLQMLDIADLVITINECTVAYFQSLTNTPVENIGVPYPLEHVRSLATPLASRKTTVLVCPRDDKQPSMQVAEALGLPLKVYFRRFSFKPRNATKILRHRTTRKDLHAHLHREQNPHHEAHLEKPMPSFWPEAGTCKLWVNLDPRFTWARFVLDAAALGVPIITTVSTGHGLRLFPQTTVRDIFAIDEAVSIGRRLVDDGDFYDRVVRHAATEIEAFTPESCAQRLYAALGI